MGDRPSEVGLFGEEGYGMVQPKNIDSGHSNFQLGTRSSGCRSNLGYLLTRHPLRRFILVSFAVLASSSPSVLLVSSQMLFRPLRFRRAYELDGPAGKHGANGLHVRPSPGDKIRKGEC